MVVLSVTSLIGTRVGAIFLFLLILPIIVSVRVGEVHHVKHEHLVAQHQSDTLGQADVIGQYLNETVGRWLSGAQQWLEDNKRTLEWDRATATPLATSVASPAVMSSYTLLQQLEASFFDLTATSINGGSTSEDEEFFVSLSILSHAADTRRFGVHMGVAQMAGTSPGTFFVQRRGFGDVPNTDASLWCYDMQPTAGYVSTMAAPAPLVLDCSKGEAVDAMTALIDGEKLSAYLPLSSTTTTSVTSASPKVVVNGRPFYVIDATNPSSYFTGGSGGMLMDTYPGWKGTSFSFLQRVAADSSATLPNPTAGYDIVVTVGVPGEKLAPISSIEASGTVTGALLGYEGGPNAIVIGTTYSAGQQKGTVSVRADASFTSSHTLYMGPYPEVNHRRVSSSTTLLAAQLSTTSETDPPPTFEGHTEVTTTAYVPFISLTPPSTMNVMELVWVSERGFPHPDGARASSVLTWLIFVLLVLMVIALVFLSQRFMVQDLDSLQNVMTSVTKLEFGPVEAERKKQKKNPFSEVNALRKNFLRTADIVKAVTKYIPVEVIQDMIRVGSLSTKEMVSRKITVCFVDINDFPVLCDRANASNLVRLSEKYFTLTTKVLMEHGCTIDKYIGDCVMGFWGAPLDYKWQAYSAICAGLDLLCSSKGLATEFEEHGHPLWLRIGMTTGQCAVGSIGSDDRLSYTALGDTVNLASRLQMLNSFYKTNLIVQGDVLREAQNTDFAGEIADLADFSCSDLFAARKLGIVRVKGKEEPTAVFQVVGVNRFKALQMLTHAQEQTPHQQVRTGEDMITSSMLSKSLTPSHAHVARRGTSPSAFALDTDSNHSAESLGRTHNSMQYNDDKRSTTSKASIAANHERKDDASRKVGRERDHLNPVEEIHVLKGSQYFVEDDACDALDEMSQAITRFEDMEFTSASRIYEYLLDSRRYMLQTMGFDLKVLRQQLETWRFYQNDPPPRDAFDPCHNMTTK